MSAQSRDKWAKELLTSTLELAWHASEPQARMVADAAAVEVERLQAAKTKAEEAELAAAGELDEVKAECDALAAHVERMRDVWQRLHLKSPVHVEVLKAYSYVMRDTPATSLARLKAEWQAEALERLYDESQGSMIVARGCLIDEARELRRQAKEARP